MPKVKFDITLNEEQAEAKAMMFEHPFIFLEGRAGSGKTLLATQFALDNLFQRKIDNIIITRPTVGTDDVGYLKGSLEDKMNPWLEPIRENFHKVYGKPDKLQKLESDDIIKLVSLNHFRGRTFTNAVVIVDEFQNLTKQQLVMCIGRLGKQSTMIFCGDGQQVDLDHHSHSAIHEVPKIVQSKFVYKKVLKSNHRHEAVGEILDILYSY